ncbi:hypothetical protein Cgig2_002991 [Carnegiea gigantea]|uniref:Uncharacterized protein n=1 Tax=Carnegiea gigantea TaxID=171969 RepID=A0A9Q1K721_9CARY|nr:hypothetical protein Cgig2_002991 [Carnegiea gigantea]
MEAYDIDPTPAPAFIPQVRYQLTSVVNTIRYGGWTDDTYLFAFPPGREAAKLNIMLTILNELNSVVYEVSNATTAYHRGFRSRVPPVTWQDVRSPVKHLTLGLELCPFTHPWRVVDVHYDDVDDGVHCRLYVLVTPRVRQVNLGSPSDSSESEFTCDCCAMEMYTCKCGLDADIFEDDDPYRRRGWVQDEVACDYICLIYLDFPERAKEVMEDLPREYALERDWVLHDRNAQLWSREEDMLYGR